MANWCNNNIRLIGSAERIESLISGWKKQVACDTCGFAVLPLDPEAGYIDRVEFTGDGLAGGTKWRPPVEWLVRLTREHPVAVRLAYTDSCDDGLYRMIIAGGTVHELHAVRTDRDGNIEVKVPVGSGGTYSLPNPLPSPEYEAKRRGVTVDEVVRQWDEEASVTIRWVNEQIERDRLGPPIAPTEANRRRVNEITHQHDNEPPASLVLARLDRFERGDAVAAG